MQKAPFSGFFGNYYQNKSELAQNKISDFVTGGLTSRKLMYPSHNGWNIMFDITRDDILIGGSVKYKISFNINWFYTISLALKL